MGSQLAVYDVSGPVVRLVWEGTVLDPAAISSVRLCTASATCTRREPY